MTKRQEALKRRVRRILAALLISLNKGAKMKSVTLGFNEMELAALIRSLGTRYDFVKARPIDLKVRPHGHAEDAAEMAGLEELKARLTSEFAKLQERRDDSDKKLGRRRPATA